MTRKPKRMVLATLGVAMILSCSYGCSTIDAVAWSPPKAPEATGQYAANTELSLAELIPIPEGHGPETIISGDDGWLYTGLYGGKIVRFRPDGTAFETYADTGGRANGMQFDSMGNLWVVDSYKGLLSIRPDGQVQSVLTEVEDQAFVFPDGIDITKDGLIWFTDASARFGDGEFHYDVFEGRATGRLITYDPTTKTSQVRARNLRFPNGIALGPDDAYILINETLGYRTSRHWIKGPKAGLTEAFIENYPGMPDDIRYNGDGTFWVALVSDRIGWVDWLQSHPTLKTILAGIIGPIYPSTDARWSGAPGYIVAVNTDGDVVLTLQDAGRHFVATTTALEFDGQLFIGSISEASIARLELPARAVEK